MLDLLPRSLRIRDYRTGSESPYPVLAGLVADRQAVQIEAGLSAGARVAIAHCEGLEFLVDLFAAWQIGATAVVAPPSLTADERTRVIKSARPALWIGADRVGECEWLPPQLPDFGTGSHSSIKPFSCPPDAPALILMTSGTTSQPKGVIHTHRSLQARLALNLAYIDGDDLERSLSALPMHFGHGLIGNCLTPLAAGASLTLWPDPGMAGLAKLADVIDNSQITFMSSVPTLWRIALKTSRPPVRGSLRRIHVGSSPLSSDLWQQIADWAGTRRIVNCYGTTETANWIGGHSLEDGEVIDGLVGRPWGGAVRVLNYKGAMEEAGEGEIVVSSPSMMTGYLDGSDQAAAVLQDAWFRTGDRGSVDQNGRLRLLGRRLHEINRSGIKIPAEEIDLLLERHPDVAEACAFPIADPVAGEVIGVAVVLDEGSAIEARHLLAWCRTIIRKEAVPSRVFIVQSLPRNDRGKLARHAMSELAVNQDE